MTERPEVFPMPLDRRRRALGIVSQGSYATEPTVAELPCLEI